MRDRGGAASSSVGRIGYARLPGTRSESSSASGNCTLVLDDPGDPVRLLDIELPRCLAIEAQPRLPAGQRTRRPGTRRGSIPSETHAATIAPCCASTVHDNDEGNGCQPHESSSGYDHRLLARHLHLRQCPHEHAVGGLSRDLRFRRQAAADAAAPPAPLSSRHRASRIRGHRAPPAFCSPAGGAPRPSGWHPPGGAETTASPAPLHSNTAKPGGWS